MHAGSSSSSSSRVVQAGLREEIIQSLNGVMSQLAVLTAESLEALRRKDPEVRTVMCPASVERSAAGSEDEGGLRVVCVAGGPDALAHGHQDQGAG